MNRKRWIMVGVTALSVGAFLVDRVFFGEPAAAVASATVIGPKASKPAPSAAAAAKTPTHEELPDPSLRYLNKLNDSNPERDVFTPSGEMVLHYKQIEQAAATQEAPEQKGPKPGSPEAFTAEHKLQATYTGPEGAMAVVNGKVVHLGQQIGGFRVTRIEPYQAEFRRGRDRALLSIPMPKTPNSSEE